ncbi:MAG: hypothetical protein RDU20_02500 [Desulfomonilaceae bacterium]|nr:hypothetical protein [Desulfomonilaceae bacterium]
MAESRFAPKTKKKRESKKDESFEVPASSQMSPDMKRKLEDLDDFIEGVLEKAGEEFLDEFRQVEGE